jgi:hypothetical protein
LDRKYLFFEFKYFGNLVSQISINPNGIVSLPPVHDCEAIFGSDCVVFSTHTNTIALWAADWDFSKFESGRSTSSGNVARGMEENENGAVYILYQVKGESPKTMGKDANAVHILYYHAKRFSTPTPSPSPNFARIYVI